MQKRGFHPTFLLFEGTCVAEKNFAYSAHLILTGCAPGKKCFSINAH